MYVFCKKYLSYTSNTGFKSLISKVVSILEYMIFEIFFFLVWSLKKHGLFTLFLDETVPGPQEHSQSSGTLRVLAPEGVSASTTHRGEKRLWDVHRVTQEELKLNPRDTSVLTPGPPDMWRGAARCSQNTSLNHRKLLLGGEDKESPLPGIPCGCPVV